MGIKKMFAWKKNNLEVQQNVCEEKKTKLIEKNQTEKKYFVKIVTSLVRVLLKLLLCSCICFVIRKKTVILGLFKTDTFNFTMYISTILTCPLKGTSLDYKI